MHSPQKPTIYHYTLFLVCFAGTAFAGVASTLMSVYLPLAARDLRGINENVELTDISAYINAVFIIGGAVGGFGCGLISDKFGRKPALILSIGSIGLFTLLTAFMNNWPAVAICRFFTGVGLGGVLVTTNTIMMEEWPKRTRAILIGILSVSIPTGIFSGGLIDFFVSSWRDAFFVGIIPLALAILSSWIVDESREWNADKLRQDTETGIPAGRYKKYRTGLISGSVIFGTMLIGLWAIFSWLPTWIQTIIVSGDGQQERGLSMMVMGVGSIAGGVISGWLMNAVGSRKSMILCFAMVSLSAGLLFKTNTILTSVVYVEIGILAVFFGASQGILSVYIPAMFPVAIRGSATGFCFNTGRILTAVAVLFVGLLVTKLGGYSNSLLIFSLVFPVGLLATIFSKQPNVN